MSCVRSIAFLATLVLGVSIVSVEALPTVCGRKGLKAIKVLGCQVKNNVCFIRDSPGGEQKAIIAEARRYKLIVIDGRCDSACEDVAERYRHKIRITERASFGFHQVQIWQPRLIHGRSCMADTGVRYPTKHLPAIQKWINARGGEPRNGMLEMRFKDAKKMGIWRMYDPSEKPH